MAKTAEEIAKNWGFDPNLDDAVEAMRQFAAQEVNAYKERLKAEFSTLETRQDPIFQLQIHAMIKLIDAVK